MRTGQNGRRRTTRDAATGQADGHTDQAVVGLGDRAAERTGRLPCGAVSSRAEPVAAVEGAQEEEASAAVATTMRKGDRSSDPEAEQ
jgi:hypothetical protein